MNKIVNNQVIIQARMGSTRLPGKVLKKLAGQTVLWHVVNRAKVASLVSRVIVATTENKEDDKIADWCKKNNVFCVRGSSEDVLARYVKTISEFPTNHIVRITADCPLVDPGIIDSLLSIHSLSEADYTTNVIKPTYPAGLDVEVVSATTLLKVDKIASLKSHREHVTIYIRENLSEFKTVNLEFGENVEHIRLTLDRQEDYELLVALFNSFPSDVLYPSIYEILSTIEQHRELLEINSKIDRYEGIKKSVAKENRTLNI